MTLLLFFILETTLVLGAFLVWFFLKKGIDTLNLILIQTYDVLCEGQEKTNRRIDRVDATIASVFQKVDVTAAKPRKNDIEKEEDIGYELDEDTRFPLTSNMNLRVEGQKDSIPIKIDQFTAD